MRFRTSIQHGMVLISLAAVLFLAACSGTSAPSAGSSTSGSTTSISVPTKVPATITASTALCKLMSLSQISGVVGGTITTLQSNVTKSGGDTAVNCVYLPTPGSGLHIDAAVSYEFSTNGQASYKADQQDDIKNQETETTLTGLGDAAFWAVRALSPNTLQLSVLKGNILLLMTLGGTTTDGSTMLTGAIALARSVLPSI